MLFIKAHNSNVIRLTLHEDDYDSAFNNNNNNNKFITRIAQITCT